VTTPTASVIVRTRDKVSTLGAAIASLRAQTVEVEVVVVDSGSTDGTVELAHRLADAVVELEPGTFSFGRSLNQGAARAAGEILFALSAHCRADDPRWVERSLEHYRQPTVAGTCGERFEPDGVSPLRAPRRIRTSDLSANPHWGYSNHAGSWRRAAWERQPFDEQAPTCEDKLWMWWAMGQGWTFVADPALYVGTAHRRAEGLVALWRREYGEHRFVAEHLDFRVRPARDVLWSWWGEFPGVSTRPRWVRRWGPHRAVEILAGHLGERAGAARRGPTTITLAGDAPAFPEAVG
jgi:rhamnosyltransferase